jgi:hypothetical protein
MIRPSSISRLKTVWEQDLQDWQKQDREVRQYSCLDVLFAGLWGVMIRKRPHRLPLSLFVVAGVICAMQYLQVPIGGIAVLDQFQHRFGVASNSLPKN